MINKKQVETVLRANGIAPSAQDEEIRSLLLSAKWSKDEVDTALMVLKENTVTKETHIDTLHKVFHSDQRLSPEEITSLLGIDVPYTSEDVNNIHEAHSNHERANVYLAIALSVMIAVASVGYVMFREQAGVFHPTSTFLMQ